MMAREGALELGGVRVAGQVRVLWPHNFNKQDTWGSPVFVDTGLCGFCRGDVLLLEL
jgi:hypothetical protein